MKIIEEKVIRDHDGINRETLYLFKHPEKLHVSQIADLFGYDAVFGEILDIEKIVNSKFGEFYLYTVKVKFEKYRGYVFYDL